jgi:serine phosphatase RsbU (regulator of sigma subunit)/DNA-binding response OmpR family regulator
MDSDADLRIVIAIDQPIFRRGLVSLLTSSQEIYLVGQAKDAAELVELCGLVEPSLAIVDLRNPLVDKLHVARILNQRYPQLKVALLVDSAEDSEAHDDLETGLIYNLQKDISEESFLDQLQQIHHGPSPALPGLSVLRVHAGNLQLLADELRSANLDRVALATLLNHYLPTIFTDSHIYLRVFPYQDLVSDPIYRENPLIEAAFRWLRTAAEPSCFAPGESYPWGGSQPLGSALLLSPVFRGSQPVGGICISISRPGQDLEGFLPSIQFLASQVSLALDRVHSQSRQQTGELVTRELVMAGKIQADILPEKAPTIPNWDISAKLESARETSGDFYDFIPLANGNWGIVVADVTDKGMGAALLMALSNTLIRTFATRYPTLPALTMSAVNERILSDSRSNMFVTAFYGILEPHTGRLRYVNAGHPPPYCISTMRGKPVDRLKPTGMALGLMEKVYWQQKIVRMIPGDFLLLYTDGITEAQDAQGTFFGEKRLLELVRSKIGSPAKVIQQAVLEEVHRFVGDDARQDDIALIVVCRKK